VVNSNLFLAQSPGVAVRRFSQGTLNINAEPCWPAPLPVVAAPRCYCEWRTLILAKTMGTAARGLSTLTLTDALRIFRWTAAPFHQHRDHQPQRRRVTEIDIDSITNVLPPTGSR